MDSGKPWAEPRTFRDTPKLYDVLDRRGVSMDLEKLRDALRAIRDAHELYDVFDGSKKKGSLLVDDLIALLDVAVEPGRVVTTIGPSDYSATQRIYLVSSLAGDSTSRRRLTPKWLRKVPSPDNAQARKVYLTENGERFVQIIKKQFEEACSDGDAGRDSNPTA